MVTKTVFSTFHTLPRKLLVEFFSRLCKTPFLYKKWNKRISLVLHFFQKAHSFLSESFFCALIGQSKTSIQDCVWRHQNRSEKWNRQKIEKQEKNRWELRREMNESSLPPTYYQGLVWSTEKVLNFVLFRIIRKIGLIIRIGA